MKRFLNADSYASTGQGFLGYNMFAYCGNNPAIGTDEAGNKFDQLTEWTDGCRNSQKRRKERRRVVVIYYANEKDGFSTQATSEFAYGEHYTEFVFIPVSTNEGLINEWKNLPNTDDVFLYAHGGSDFLRTGPSGTISIDSLTTDRISGNIYLLSCHGYDLARQMAENNNCCVVACDHYVSYSPFGGLSYAFAGGRLQNFLLGRKQTWYMVDANGAVRHLNGNCLINPWEQLG